MNTLANSEMEVSAPYHENMQYLHVEFVCKYLRVDFLRVNIYGAIFCVYRLRICLRSRYLHPGATRIINHCRRDHSVRHHQQAKPRWPGADVAATFLPADSHTPALLPK